MKANSSGTNYLLMKHVIPSFENDSLLRKPYSISIH